MSTKNKKVSNIKPKENELETQNKQINTPVVRKRFCAKAMGEICFGDETDAKCGSCGHWI